MKIRRYQPIMLAVTLTALLLVALHPAGALAQCGGGDHQSMHQQHMGSSGQMGMGSGQMGMSGQMGSGQMMSSQMGMSNNQADPNAAAPEVAPVTSAPQGANGSGQMTGMDHSGRQH